MAKQPDLTGKTCLVTGATNGIGKASATALAKMGAEVFLLGRNPDKGAQTIEEIRAACGHDRLTFLRCDLSEQAQIHAAAARFLETGKPLHILLNNAGLLNRERHVTVDGFEETWAVNHLAYVLLTDLLLPRLRESAPARIVNVSSMAYTFTKEGLQWDDLQFEHNKYTLFGAYAHSKLANILYTDALARHLADSGVTANSLHPGGVRSGLGQQNASPILKFLAKFILLFLKKPQDGAKTSVYLCSSPEVEGKTGLFWDKCKPKARKPYAADPTAAARLWERSYQQLQREAPTLPS